MSKKHEKCDFHDFILHTLYVKMSQNHEKYVFHDLILYTSYFVLMLMNCTKSLNYEKYDFIL